jgi:hypothetical protein
MEPTMKSSRLKFFSVAIIKSYTSPIVDFESTPLEYFPSFPHKMLWAILANDIHSQ